MSSLDKALAQGHTKILNSGQDLNPLLDVYYTWVQHSRVNNIMKKSVTTASHKTQTSRNHLSATDYLYFCNCHGEKKEFNKNLV